MWNASRRMRMELFNCHSFSCNSSNSRYYKLSSANRAFSAEAESLGEATIIFNLTDKGLVVEFRDYDGDYVELYGGFDPDFFSIPSLFVKE